MKTHKVLLWWFIVFEILQIADIVTTCVYGSVAIEGNPIAAVLWRRGLLWVVILVKLAAIPLLTLIAIWLEYEDMPLPVRACYNLSLAINTGALLAVTIWNVYQIYRG